MLNILTKDQVIAKLIDISKLGYVDNRRHGNDGGVGNTLEDLLGIEENNLPIPNAAEWELKTQRWDTGSLITLFHLEPSPKALSLVSNFLLPRYGWKHKNAGIKYPEHEKSFRMTLNAKEYTGRGFKVTIDHESKKVHITFDHSKVKEEHYEWLEGVGSINLEPQPYWGFQDLASKAGTKLPNMFLVFAKRRKIDGKEKFHYFRVYMLERFSLDNLLKGFEAGEVFIDFDARTGHNHGTKFRVKREAIHKLFDSHKLIIDQAP